MPEWGNIIINEGRNAESVQVERYIMTNKYNSDQTICFQLSDETTSVNEGKSFESLQTATKERLIKWEGLL